jgi:hypothetical protein
MSLGRPSRRVGMLKEVEVGTVNRFPVVTSSSSIPSWKFGILLLAPDRTCKAVYHTRINFSYMHGRSFEIRCHPCCVSTVVAYVAPGGQIVYLEGCCHRQTLLGWISSQEEGPQTHIRGDCLWLAVWPWFDWRQVCGVEVSKRQGGLVLRLVALTLVGI